MEFDFQRMIAYYNKVLAGCLKSGGEDWRWALYRERRDHIARLSIRADLTPADRQYLIARQAVAESFG